MSEGASEPAFSSVAMDRVDVAFDPSPAPEWIGLGLSSGTVALAQISPIVPSATVVACSRNRERWSIDDEC